jgi:hypothetical protein
VTPTNFLIFAYALCDIYYYCYQVVDVSLLIKDNRGAKTVVETASMDEEDIFGDDEEEESAPAEDEEDPFWQ